MSGGRRKLGRRTGPASDGDVNAEAGGEMEVSSSEGQGTPPVRGPSGQIDANILVNDIANRGFVYGIAVLQVITSSPDCEPKLFCSIVVYGFRTI